MDKENKDLEETLPQKQKIKKEEEKKRKESKKASKQLAQDFTIKYFYHFVYKYYLKTWNEISKMGIGILD